MQRMAGALELLDGGLDDEAALRGNLADLRRVNRLLGGTAISLRAVRELLAGQREPVRIVDVGTGAADIPLAMLRSLDARAGLEIVASDSRVEVLAAARALDPELDRAAGLSLAVADGRRLPWRNGSFDVAHASLVLHHLEPPDAVAFLSELRRVARVGVVVNDLVRGRAWWAVAWLGSRLLTPNPLTRHDAPLSVLRAYSVAEMDDLLAAAGLRPVSRARAVLGHRVAIAARPVD